MASAEIESFRIRFAYEFDRLLETLADLDDEAVKFAATGGSGHLAVRATDVRRRIDEALTELEGRLDEERDPPFGKWAGSRATVRDRLIHSVSHTAEHVGHAQLTRDLYNARRGST